MKAFFDRMCYIPATNAIWEHAEQLARDLDRTGKIIQVTDLTIACCALQREVAVLTFDGDFNRVPGLRVLSSIE